MYNCYYRMHPPALLFDVPPFYSLCLCMNVLVYSHNRRRSDPHEKWTAYSIGRP